MRSKQGPMPAGPHDIILEFCGADGLWRPIARAIDGNCEFAAEMQG